MRTAVVLGAGGFIGSHLVNRLCHQGYWVRGVDLHYPEFAPTQAQEFLIADLRDYEQAKAALTRSNALGSIDEVYQLAADMGGAEYIFTGDHDAQIMRNSALINLNVCELCVKLGIPRVFYSSSACVYPAEGVVYCDESTAYPAQPDSEYGWEKLFSERLYAAYARNHGLQARIARFHNIFGPHGTWTGGREKAPAAICRKIICAANQALATDSPTVQIQLFGDGAQTRTFLYIEECLNGIIRLMQQPTFMGPVNLGSTELISINQLAERVFKLAQADNPALADKRLVIVHIPGPLGVRGRCSSNQLIMDQLGWAPAERLTEGLACTYSWIKGQIQLLHPTR
jgi:nucleoside-diphosphate-sugar epimerase